MRIKVTFQDDAHEIEVDEAKLVGNWPAPEPVAEDGLRYGVANALENPLDYPPLRSAVVPGDRVVIALGAGLPDPGQIVAAACETLERAGVDRGSITILTSEGSTDVLHPAGTQAARHDPADRDALAYLSTSASGRRIYLNRLLTDADFVLPIGSLGYDPKLGYHGPWSVLFPGLSDPDSLSTYGGEAKAPASRVEDRPPSSRDESGEVGWLLGSQFQIGVVEGTGRVIAGKDETVRHEGEQAVDAAWSIQADRRAAVVVAGVGGSGASVGWDELVSGLETASHLVHRGGKIVVFSHAQGEPGDAIRRLAGIDDPRAASAALKGAEGAADYRTAKRLADVLAWSDVYLLSDLDEGMVEDLAMIPLARPEEARKLWTTAESCTVVSQADRRRARAEDD